MRISRVRALILVLIPLSLSVCDTYGQGVCDETDRVTITSVRSKTVTVTQSYVCQIEARRHIEVRTPVEGYLTAVPIEEGQAAKRGDLLFQVEPLADKPRLDDQAESKKVDVKAPFDGLVGRLPRQQGSFVLKGETLTTLSDNSVMWVYFNVSETLYLEYMAGRRPDQQSPDIELTLADNSKFPRPGKIGAIEADFNSETGNIAFRADFPNPNGLLRHGQTGTVVLSRVVKDAIVIPQRATFEILAKKYVYVVDRDHVAHQREIVVQQELEDIFVIKQGVGVGDKIILEGVRQVHDGDKLEPEDLEP